MLRPIWGVKSLRKGGTQVMGSRLMDRGDFCLKKGSRDQQERVGFLDEDLVGIAPIARLKLLAR